MSKKLNKIKIDFILGKISYEECLRKMSKQLTKEIQNNAIQTINYERNQRMKNRKPRYTYVSDANGNIYAISTYAGKTVRGVAKYNPNDKFDEQIGMELAAARCNKKIAKKRYTRSIKKWNEARAQLAAAQYYLARMEDYFETSRDAYDDAVDKVSELENKLK